MVAPTLLPRPLRRSFWLTRVRRVPPFPFSPSVLAALMPSLVDTSEYADAPATPTQHAHNGGVHPGLGPVG